MATKSISEQEKRELESFGRLADGMETRRKELLAEAHRRAEIELHQYRMSVLNKLEELTKRYSVSQIVKATGLARSTVYRWMERLRQERIVAEAASRGIMLGGVGGLGGFGATSVADTDLLVGGDGSPLPQEQKTPEELGWRNIKRTVSGEIGAIDRQGDTWMFNADDGEAWNKTKNERIDSVANWPEGAKELVDSLTQ